MVFSQAQATTIYASPVACPRCGRAGNQPCVLSPFDASVPAPFITAAFHYSRAIQVLAPPAQGTITGRW